MHPPIHRGLKPGLHPYLDLIPRVRETPAMHLVYRDEAERERLLVKAAVRIVDEEGFAWIDEAEPCIVLTYGYYREGSERDLYLDLLHELTHLRQLDEGRDVWDERFEYVDRETEIEGYSVAIAEGRRLGMNDDALRLHLCNPWMTDGDVERLFAHIQKRLGA